ncbi:MAG: hypothetical protein HDT02_03625 [Bacteroidales bacterium]|nr:hypothetical protein [Bacteroidales bacterium]
MHISSLRSLLALRTPVSLTVLTSKGEIQTYDGCISLRWDRAKGTRNIKLPNGQIRRIRDVMILAANNHEVYL